MAEYIGPLGDQLVYAERDSTGARYSVDIITVRVFKLPDTEPSVRVYKSVGKSKTYEGCIDVAIEWLERQQRIEKVKKGG